MSFWNSIKLKHTYNYEILDECDSIFGQRSKSDSDTTKKIKAQLLGYLDGLESQGGIILVGTSNRPWDFDNAFYGRQSCHR